MYRYTLEAVHTEYEYYELESDEKLTEDEAFNVMIGEGPWHTKTGQWEHDGVNEEEIK